MVIEGCVEISDVGVVVFFVVGVYGNLMPETYKIKCRSPNSCQR